MQEHIRRAHPEHYISKLPATEESFHLMISTPPSERPPQQNSGSSHVNKGHSHGYPQDDSSNGADEYQGGAMFPAAAALAQLHNHKMDNAAWDAEAVRR